MKPPRPEIIKLAEALAVSAAIEDARADGQHVDDRTVRELRALTQRPARSAAHVPPASFRPDTLDWNGRPMAAAPLRRLDMMIAALKQSEAALRAARRL